MNNVELVRERPAVFSQTPGKDPPQGGAPETSFSLECLAEALDRVVRICPDLPLLAIPWIHIKHPIHPVQEELILRPDRGEHGTGPGPAMVLRCVSRFFTSFIYAGYFMLRILQVRLRYAGLLQRLKRGTFQIIAKTWRFESSSGSEDFYYGDLQERLAKRGVRMLMLYGYPRGRSWEGFRSSARGMGWELPELCLVSLLSPLRFACQQLRTSFRLMRLARNERGLVRSIARRAAWDCLSFRNLPIALYDGITRHAVSLWHPAALLTLYEGHAWEKSAWAAARAKDPSCKIIGYQHTILLPHQLALFRERGRSPLTAKPDVVLCLGPRTQQMLGPSHRQSRLVPFGSFRKSDKARGPVYPDPRKQTVLVLPEGHLEEMKCMFDTAMRAAVHLPEYRFILRCHPIFGSPVEQVGPTLEVDPASLPNVEFSTGRWVEEDFAKSSVVLYRGSSAILYALLFGLKPIYLHDEILRDSDPLFELTEWRQEVSSIAELTQSLRAYAQADAGQLIGEWETAKEYVSSYVGNVEEGSIDRLLEALS